MTPSYLIDLISEVDKITIHYRELAVHLEPPEIPILMKLVEKGCITHKCRYYAPDSTWTFTKKEKKK